MLDQDTQLLLLVGGAAFLFIVAVALLLLPNEDEKDKRVKNITARQKVRNEKAREATTVDRRKKVQDKLDDVEAMRNKTVNVSLRVKLIQAGLKISERQYYIYSIVFAILVGVGAYMGAGLNMYACIGLTIIAGIGLPKWFVGHLARSRQAKFIAEFANTLDVMVRGVKTGLPLVETLEIVANESPEPIRSEFNEVVEQQRVGITLAEALDRMHARIPLPDVNFFKIVVSIQQQSGGSLSEALGNLSTVLRARTQMAAKVKALSAEAKASAGILAALPFFVMGSTYMLNPDYIALLWRESIGHAMLAGAAIWMSIGILVMRSMINFKY